MDDGRVPQERLRASDADRDAVAARLADALAEGRLDLSEYDDRLHRAMHSKTMGELRPLTADLPEPAPPPEDAGVDLAEVGRAADPDALRRSRSESWRGLAGLAVILVGIWGVTSVIAGQLLPFWPLWPLGFMLIFTVANTLSGGERPENWEDRFRAREERRRMRERHRRGLPPGER
ncbi:DUF1707 SHOCT-like domain-containing protein [Marinitenerispora sediminis]|uniref:DUF1707 domain-containing protein n=1 Tax=Marinitenerispora sediminis TaxID=1931232 RepID=A0A368T6Q8_9ACTN|nr:DUF1707 domain-containing protein [Marinitenerispora sediminis]RCV50647.1 hypothetical protein DEF28_17485 [Marinitenerispora sediminis]RCV56211.1 hypothetical protein DEF23_13040 [Marinitenerispora sediminis]RCV59442.1 hypothetical protein DEF24_09710 [Marinitenerispora sediminis]